MGGVKSVAGQDGADVAGRQPLQRTAYNSSQSKHSAPRPYTRKAKPIARTRSRPPAPRQATGQACGLVSRAVAGKGSSVVAMGSILLSSRGQAGKRGKRGDCMRVASKGQYRVAFCGRLRFLAWDSSRKWNGEGTAEVPSPCPTARVASILPGISPDHFLLSSTFLAAEAAPPSCRS